MCCRGEFRDPRLGRPESRPILRETGGGWEAEPALPAPSSGKFGNRAAQRWRWGGAGNPSSPRMSLLPNVLQFQNSPQVEIGAILRSTPLPAPSPKSFFSYVWNLLSLHPSHWCLKHLPTALSASDFTLSLIHSS